MTREEAIKILRKEIECLSHTKCEDCILEAACDPIKTTPYDSEYIEVYEMAITALEQEPNGDLISREWLKTAIHNFYYGLKHTPTEEDIQAYIDVAPSVNPQEPKTRHWIFQKIKYGEHLAPMRMWCSNCNSAFDLCCNQIKRYDEATKKEYLWCHCPWCGARMESEDK